MIGILSLCGMFSLIICYQFTPDIMLPVSIFIGCVLIANAIEETKKR